MYLEFTNQANQAMILRLLLTALAVIILAYVLPGVEVTSYWTAILVAVVLGLLRLFVKPILVLLTLPATILTLGLFLLIINACIILMADYFVGGFAVDGFWWAFLFALLLSILQSVFYSMLEKDR